MNASHATVLLGGWSLPTGLYLRSSAEMPESSAGSLEQIIDMLYTMCITVKQRGRFVATSHLRVTSLFDAASALQAFVTDISIR
jgi:hypothetical protein